MEMIEYKNIFEKILNIYNSSQNIKRLASLNYSRIVSFFEDLSELKQILYFSVPGVQLKSCFVFVFCILQLCRYFV